MFKKMIKIIQNSFYRAQGDENELLDARGAMARTTRIWLLHHRGQILSLLRKITIK